MKKALLIAGLLSCTAIPVARAEVSEEPKQETITQQDFEDAQKAIVAVITEAIAEVADDSDQDAKTEA